MINHDTTTQLISVALDASLMRQTAIARNIANANTVNYQTLTVNFEQQLASNTDKTFSTIEPFYETSTRHSPIDEQLALSVNNATQFRALIKGLNHQLAIMNLALQGNHSS